MEEVGALQVFEESYHLDLHNSTTFISLLARHSRWAEALDVFAGVERRRVPDVVCWSAAISACEKGDLEALSMIQVNSLIQMDGCTTGTWKTLH